MRLEVPHQRDECRLVRLQRLAEHRRKHAVILAFARLHPRKARVVELHPVGRVGERRVLPRPKPQQHYALVMRPRLIEQRLHEREVELALDRLDLLPCHRHFKRVRVHPVEHRPHRGQLRHIVARIVRLSPEHQIWHAVDDQRMAARFRLDPRDRCRLRERRGGGDKGQGGNGDTHEIPLRTDTLWYPYRLYDHAPLALVNKDIISEIVKRASALLRERDHEPFVHSPRTARAFRRRRLDDGFRRPSMWRADHDRRPQR
jgi:hypothetical protein